ncbi:MAG TPA: hypothetical protein VGX37_05975 [Allosphingosinicella sp.]|jgi:hypothetical protein|nr:hypothetical protein [Allosphingosinicella sp.]
MKTSRKLSRRSFFASVAGGAVIGGGATALLTGRAEAQSYTGVTDADTGEVRDRPGYGVGTRSVYTDRDTGPNADPQFHGRGPQGEISGQGQYGEYPSGCSDSDGGPGADPGGRGVRCNGQQPPIRRPPDHTRHCTDSDTGGSADPVQQGRNC